MHTISALNPQKSFARLLQPRKTPFIEFEECIIILGTALQGDEALFYIAEQQNAIPKVSAANKRSLRDMMTDTGRLIQCSDDYKTKLDDENEISKTYRKNQYEKNICEEDLSMHYHHLWVSLLLSVWSGLS